MTTIKLIVTGASAQAEVDGLLTSGMVGIPVTIVCDGAWDGLTKSMVCRAGRIVKTILNVENSTTVAHECMVPNQTLFIGIEGRNADGTLVIPTVWARCGLIFSGATTDADPSADPTLPVWAQIQSMIGNLDDLNTPAKENLVAAINEALTQGGGVDPEAVQKIVDAYLAENPPASGADGKDGITPTIGENGNWYLGDTDTGKPSRGADGATGATGATGEKGADGKSAYQYAVEGGYTGTEAEFAAKLAEEIPSGGTGNEILQIDENILASGTISTSEQGAFVHVDTGLTFGDLRKWKRFAFLFIPGTSCYCRMWSEAHGMYGGVAGVRPLQVYEWEDAEKTLLSCIYSAGADGWFTSLDSNFTDADKFDLYANRQVRYRYSTVIEPDNAKVYVNVYTKLDVDVPWKITGIIKYVEG